MRLPSDHTCRMASVPKMFLKIAESIVPVGMARPFCFVAFLATKPIAVILRCALLRASKDAAQAVALRGSTLTRRALRVTERWWWLSLLRLDAGLGDQIAPLRGF